MTFFYRHKPWYAGQFVRMVKPKFKVTEGVSLFFNVILNKLSAPLLNVLVRNVDDTFVKSVIRLPVSSAGLPNFAFMEKFVAELKAQRVAELKAYLTAAGLNDTTLTLEEEEALQHLQNGQIEFADFNLKELFGKAARGKRLKSDDRITGSIPFITAGESNEGFSDYIGNDVRIFPKNTVTIDMFGSAKYRNYEYGADDHVAIVFTQDLPRHCAIFVASATHKATYTGQYNYGNNFYASDADVTSIKLPINLQGEPDYGLMRTIISAVEKLVICDVVAFADKKIDATKQIIS